MPSGQRRGRWAGLSLKDRQTRRRDDLIAAGTQLFGAEGGPALTVRAVCRDAGLTERYFYESFADRDEFVRAVYAEVCQQAMSTLATAATPREAVDRFVALVVDDPVRGRALLLAPEAEPALQRCGSDWMPNFIELVQRRLTTITDPALQAMTATGLVGALTALFMAYLNGRLPVERTQFVDYCVEMLLNGRPLT